MVAGNMSSKVHHEDIYLLSLNSRAEQHLERLLNKSIALRVQRGSLMKMEAVDDVSYYIFLGVYKSENGTFLLYWQRKKGGSVY